MKVHHLYDFYSLQMNQWKTPQAIRRIQEKKLKRLINHAYQRVPYYKELFDSQKIDPRDIRNTDDLQSLPVTSKKILSDLKLNEKIAKGINLRRCKSTSTSGTIGIPLKIYSTRCDSTLMNLSWARAYLNSGMKPWYKTMAFIGHQNVKEKKSWYEYLGIWRRKEISAWNDPEFWIKEIKKWKPHVMLGYVMTLKLLAEAVQKYQIKDVSPKIIFHSSALLDDFSRQFLKSVFRTKIIDVYGSDEGGCIAWECKDCSGYHICADMLIVEVLKNGAPASSGEAGEVVLTNLHSYAMPFIRYRQEDVAALSIKQPVCGRNLPLLENIQGRTDDFIILKNGQKISPHPFYHCIDPVIGVRRWKIYQERIDKITVELETGKEFDNNNYQIVKNNLEKLVKGELEIEIIKVDSIPIDPSLKFRAVSSQKLI